MNDIKETLINCLDRNGIELNGDNEDIEIIDSISFITIIVDIENEFNIEFPDEYLIIDNINNFEKLYNTVLLLIEDKFNSTEKGQVH